MYDGYLEFGGTELINAARTTAYVKLLMPEFPLVKRGDEYDVLPAALEQEPYISPLVDDADWVSPDDVTTQRFYGLYPLTIRGIGDSTMSAESTEGVLDGGYIGEERDSTREILVTGMLIAQDELAAEAGLTWLRAALRRNICGMHDGLCGYADLRYFLAEPTIVEPGAPIVEQLEPVDRSYHRVGTTSGVKVIASRPVSCGYAITVSFVLTAGNPHAYSTYPTSIEFDPLADPIPFTDAIVNYSTNPYGSNYPDSADYPGWTLTSPTNMELATQFYFDITAIPNILVRHAPATGFPDADGTEGVLHRIVIPFGGPWSFSARAGAYLDHRPLRLEVLVDGIVAATVVGTSGTLSVQGLVIPDGGPYDVDLRISGDTALPKWSFQASPFGDLPDGLGFKVREVVATFGETLPVDFWGDVPTGYERVWDGEPFFSTSRIRPRVNTPDPLVDPDVPALPEPPRPPSIPNLSVEPIANWLRYSTDIPANQIPLWASAVPSVRLTSSDAAIRQVRVRFYANPNSFPHEYVYTLEPCGEFVLSYLPPDTVLSVLGVDQRAFAEVAGGQPVTAGHLLYGQDGAPMEWAELSCHLPYVMTVDVPPSFDVSDLGIELLLHRKE